MSSVATRLLYATKPWHALSDARRMRSRTAAHSQRRAHLLDVLVAEEGLPAPVGRVVSPHQLHLRRGHRQGGGRQGTSSAWSRVRIPSLGLPARQGCRLHQGTVGLHQAELAGTAHRGTHISFVELLSLRPEEVQLVQQLPCRTRPA